MLNKLGYLAKVNVPFNLPWSVVGPCLNYVLLDVQTLVNIFEQPYHLSCRYDFVPQRTDEKNRLLDLGNSLNGPPVVGLEEFEILEDRHDGVNHVTDAGERVFQNNSLYLSFELLVGCQIHRDCPSQTSAIEEQVQLWILAFTILNRIFYDGFSIFLQSLFTWQTLTVRVSSVCDQNHFWLCSCTQLSEQWNPKPDVFVTFINYFLHFRESKLSLALRLTFSHAIPESSVRLPF